MPLLPKIAPRTPAPTEIPVCKLLLVHLALLALYAYFGAPNPFFGLSDLLGVSRPKLLDGRVPLLASRELHPAGELGFGLCGLGMELQGFAAPECLRTILVEMGLDSACA